METSWLSSVLEINIMYVILGAFVVGIIVSLWIIEKDEESPYSITDLIVENGKLSEQKLSRMGAWIVSTWGFVYLVATQNLSEWYFVGYMGTWVASAILSSRYGHKPEDKSNDNN